MSKKAGLPPKKGEKGVQSDAFSQTDGKAEGASINDSFDLVSILMSSLDLVEEY